MKELKHNLKLRWLVSPVLLGGFIFFLTHNIALSSAIMLVLLTPIFIDIYLPYAKDNPQHLWFKRKIYGWGWTPVTWQGWIITFIYVGLLVLFALTLDENSPAKEVLFTFVLPVTLLTITFIKIAYKKGERPKWQWGDKEK